MPAGKPGSDNLINHKWTPAGRQEHILGSLREKSLDSHRLLPLIGPKNRYGATYFQVFLQNARGETSKQPVIMGLHHRGSYPAYNWIEVMSLAPKAKFDSGEEVSLGISSNGRIRQLFKYLADLLPPGGHMMVEYDSPEQRDTAQLLALGIPPIATPLGYTLFLAGCGLSFKDWYFAEGGIEGPRKLQGHKALDSRHARMKTAEIVQELGEFLRQPPPEKLPQLEKATRERALAVLRTLSARPGAG